MKIKYSCFIKWVGKYFRSMIVDLSNVKMYMYMMICIRLLVIDIFFVVFFVRNSWYVYIESN